MNGRTRMTRGSAAGLLLCTACLATGCQRGLTTGEPAATQSTSTQPATPEALAAAAAPGAARMWSQNCMRCHNLRPPSERSDREWEVIVHHMRVRANLTAQEHREIVRFLKAAN